MAAKEPLVISFSSVQLFHTCPWQWYLRYVARIRAIGQEAGRPLEFGNAFHQAQAVYWAGQGDRAERLGLALALWNDVSTGLAWEDRYLGRVLLTGYAVRWADDNFHTGTRPLAERRVRVPVLDADNKPDPELLLEAAMDVEAWDDQGRRLLVEHKTTTQDLQAAAYWKRIENSLQASTYFYVAAQLGAPVQYLIWDAIRAPRMKRALATPIERREFYVRGDAKGRPKPGTRLADEDPAAFEARVLESVVEDPEAHFQRRTFTRTEAQLYRAQCDLWSTGRLMLDVIARGGAAPRIEDSCDKYGRPCDYKPACWGGADLADPKLYRISTRRAQQ